MYRRKARILFLCTGNSCRSQMAEGWANHLGSEWLEATSAGIEAHGKNPRPVPPRIKPQIPRHFCQAALSYICHIALA